MTDTTQTPAPDYLEVVNVRDAATLLPIILQYMHPGSIIHNGEWAAYNREQQILTVEFICRHAYTKYRILLE